jgi:hypothetical protein
MGSATRITLPRTYADQTILATGTADNGFDGIVSPSGHQKRENDPETCQRGRHPAEHGKSQRPLVRFATVTSFLGPNVTRSHNQLIQNRNWVTIVANRGLTRLASPPRQCVPSDLEFG